MTCLYNFASKDLATGLPQDGSSAHYYGGYLRRSTAIGIQADLQRNHIAIFNHYTQASVNRKPLAKSMNNSSRSDN